MNAKISPCGQYRYWLHRDINEIASGKTFAYFGINPSTADAIVDDQTIKKLKVFTAQYGGKEFYIGNAFAYRTKDVKKLAKVNDPIGPYNMRYLRSLIILADVLVPCWGDSSKVPKRLRTQFEMLLILFRNSGKPIKVFGLTKNGDPLHPLMLPYSTELVACTPVFKG